MAQSGYTPIQLYYSTTTTNTPAAADLVNGELAINIPDGKLFYKDGSTVKVIASTASATNVSSFTTSLSGLTPSTATTGAVTLAGTLGVTSGGTGTSTAFTTGSVVFAGASGTYTQDNANFFWDDTNNYLGIGTAAPTTKLTINNNTALPSAGAFAGTGLWQVGADASTNGILLDSFGATPQINARRASGTAASPTAVLSQVQLLSLFAFGYGATGYSSANRGRIQIYSSELWTDTAQGTYISFSTTQNGTTTTTEKVRILDSGAISFGSSGTAYGTSGQVLTSGGASASPTWATPTTGTVTSVSVVSANGLAGTSSGGATPALTLSTTVTGVLKGNGTAISAAVSGTDYAPATSGTSILYGNGSGGFSNVTVGTGLSFSTGTLTATATSSQWTTTGSDIYYNTGNVGIGTTSPTGKLQVNSSTASIAKFYGNNANNYIQLSDDNGSSFVSFGSIGGGNIYTYSSGYNALYAGGNERMRIDSSGNVGIGNTPSGTYKLEVTGKTYSSGGFIPRSLAAASATGTVTPASDTYDQVNYLLTGTVAFAVPSGTPTNGQKLNIRLYAASTQTVSWTTTSTGYRIIGTTLPTSVASGKTVYVGCVWNSTDSFWDVVAVATQA